VVIGREEDAMKTALRFTTDIRPLFRESDITAMRAFGSFDLGRHADVVEHHESIRERLRDGSMPCDAPWPEPQIKKFEDWIVQGMLE
jgi:hypothetical protein